MKKHKIDMCNGAIFSQLVRFTIPLILSGELQILFNAADTMVVGRFSGSDSLAAVGSTSSLINLLINLFIGISIGTDVLVAKAYSTNKKEEMEKIVYTSVITGLICGIILILLGNILAQPLLLLMGTPDDVIGKAVLYMRIYFWCMPGFIVFNFGSAVLRSSGDSKIPLYYISLAGVINIILNLIFVIICNMDVAGVGLASVISQSLSGCLIVLYLIRNRDICRLVIKGSHIDKRILANMIRIGLPAGIQSTLINLSNTLIQSSVNSFGSLTMAGHAAATNIEMFMCRAVNAVSQSALSFTGQNMGAARYRRVKRIMLESLFLAFIVGETAGIIANIAGRNFLGAFTTDTRVVDIGMIKLMILGIPYGLFGFMDVLPMCIRGMGYSVAPMLISLTGVCLFRVFWINTIFAGMRTLEVLYMSYPVSWIFTTLMQVILFMCIRKKAMPEKQ